MNQNRINRVLSSMQTEGVPQLLICDSDSIAYLTGDNIQPGERYLALLLQVGKRPKLFLNRLFAAKCVPEEDIIYYDDTVRGAVITAGMTDRNAVLGIDKRLASEFLLELQENGAAARYVNGSPIIDHVRACKDAEEIILMRESSRLNDIAIEAIRDRIREGVTEEQLSSELLQIYKDLGTDSISFSPNVSFGANAADPHHDPDGTVLKEGGCVLFDIGCLKESYCSDMTRTYYFRSVSDLDREIYDLVLKANKAGEAAIHPGARFCDIDAAARKVIEDAGYGQYFTHRLGHSIGRAVHEWGDVSSVNTETVKPGMIFSCEPGIYLPGKTGVRIEDLCLVTEDGVEILNHSSKELRIIE